MAKLPVEKWAFPHSECWFFRHRWDDRTAAEHDYCPDIFEKHGEAYFRKLETELVESLIGTQIGVLSVGGGLAVTKGNDILLKKLGTVVYLKAGKECLIKRLKGDSKRPLLAGGNLEKK